MALILYVHFGPLLNTLLHIRKIRIFLLLTVSLCIGKAFWMKCIEKCFVRSEYVAFFRGILRLKICRGLFSKLTSVTIGLGKWDERWSAYIINDGNPNLLWEALQRDWSIILYLVAHCCLFRSHPFTSVHCVYSVLHSNSLPHWQYFLFSQPT